MATPRSRKFRVGPTTPASTRNRRNQPPEAELPILDTASNRLYGSTIPALPNDSETGARLTQSSIAVNMAGSRAAGSQSARSERSNRDERAANRDLVREGRDAARARRGQRQTEELLPLSSQDIVAATNTRASTLPLLPSIPQDSERPGTGGTTSKTWEQETGYNGQAELGIDQSILPGRIRDAQNYSEQVAVPSKGGRHTSGSVRDGFSEHGGSPESSPERSNDNPNFPRRERRRNAPNIIIWISELIAQFVLMSSLLLLILWGVGRTGLLRGFNLPGFSVPVTTNHLESSSTHEIIRKLDSAIIGQSEKLSKLSKAWQNTDGSLKGIIRDLVEIKETQLKGIARDLVEVRENQIKGILRDLVEIKESQKRFALNETVEVELKKIYPIIRKLTQDSLMYDESIRSLQSILPELTWISRSPAGDIVIQQDFWLALRSKIEHEFGRSKPGSTDADLWERFLELNESRMRSYISGAVEKHLHKASGEGVLVTREHLLTIIQDNFEKHSQDIGRLTEVFEEKYRITDKRMDSINKDLERKVAITAMQKVEALSDRISRTLPAAQLEALVQANIDRNSQQALTSINYFSPGMGATVDPRYSSNTYRPSRSLVSKFLGLFFPMAVYVPKGPDVALYGWEEPLDCWCSSNSSDGETLGNAQIAVSTATALYPKDITVEHIPRTAVPSVRNAPKDMELWVSVQDPSLYEMLEEESEALLGHAPPRGGKMGSGWLRIATWRYTPYGVNHVLNFPVQVDLETLGIPGKYFMVRATSNWGADFTCFYRIRMGGKAVDPSAWRL